MRFRSGGSSSLRLLAPSSLTFGLLVTGCAPTAMNLAQELALERWKKCDHIPRVELLTIHPDGQIWARYSSSRSWELLQECLRQAAAEQGARTAVVKPPAPAGTPSPEIPKGPSAPTWQQGYEWAYRWGSPLGTGTFVWSMEREEAVDGTECYVVRTGSREIFMRKDDLAWYMDKVQGAVEVRNVPPRMWITWPLNPGKSWEQAYDRQKPLERITEGIVMVCAVEAEETITVPAGTFSTFKIVCRRGLRTGVIMDEIWYSPEIKHWIRERSHFSYGIRERELIAYKVR